MKQNRTKEEIDKFTMIVVEFIIHFSVIDKVVGQEFSWNVKDPNDTIDSLS